jgi:hypothetical protein
MSMNNHHNDEFIFDCRIVQRNIRDGRLKRENYEKRITDLPDLSLQCEDIGEEVYSLKNQGLALSIPPQENRDKE